MFIGLGVIFCVYEYILKMFFTILKCPEVLTFVVRTVSSKNVHVLVFSAGNNTGIFGGEDYWSGRR